MYKAVYTALPRSGFIFRDEMDKEEIALLAPLSTLGRGGLLRCESKDS